MMGGGGEERGGLVTNHITPNSAQPSPAQAANPAQAASPPLAVYNLPQWLSQVKCSCCFRSRSAVHYILLSVTERRGERGIKMPKHFWTYEEITALLSLWGADSTQKEIRDRQMKKPDIFKKISNEMNRMGINRTMEQCYSKMSNMIFQHKKVRGKYIFNAQGLFTRLTANKLFKQGYLN